MPVFGNSPFSMFGNDAAAMDQLVSWTDQGATTAASCYTSSTGGLLGLPGNTLSTTTASSQACISQMIIAQNATTSTTTTTNTVYWYFTEQEQWVEHSQYLGLARQRAFVFRERTAEQQRELAERQRIAAEQNALRMIAHQAALAKSRELLVSHLTKEQLRTFEKNKWFVVEGGRSKQLYRIRDGGYSGNIDVLAGERVTHRLCCHCLDSAVPIYDHLLAQKLHLQYDEDAFLQIANRHAA
jgi:hypothetical protein